MTVKLELDLRTGSNSLTSAVMQYDGLLVVCGEGNSKFANFINVLFGLICHISISETINRATMKHDQRNQMSL
jgi:ACT domain-containing protein